MKEEMIRMGTSSLAQKFVESGFPKMPTSIEWDNGKWKYLDTFCLGCKKSGVDLSKTIHLDHTDCNAAVVIIHKEFTPAPSSPEGYPPDTFSEDMAKKKVNEEIEKLRADEEYLNSFRERYSGFMANWKNNETQSSLSKL